MSFFKKHRTLTILAWFVALYLFNVLLGWSQNADKSGLFIALAAIDRLMTPPEIVLSAAVGYGIVSKRPSISTGRLAAYAAIGLVAISVAFALSNQNQVRNASVRILKSFGGSTIAKRQPLSPVELFQKLSPSVFVVEAVGQDGDTLMLGSAVAVGRNFLITNCHVVQGGSFLRVRRGAEKWSATLIQAIPDHDLCGLKPSGLTLSPVDVLSSSKITTGERVYAIGAPEGLELTFSEGVVSALRETDGDHMIQTSAPISPGSSGGGLFDAQGNLVGITTFYLKEGQSLNFALPGEWVVDILARSNVSAENDEHTLSDAALESTAWIEIGRNASQQKNYGLAESAFQNAIRLQQSDAYRAWFELGNMYRFELHRDNDAMASFEQAIRLKPDHAETWLKLAYIHAGRKELNQALAAAKEATRLAPSEKETWQELGLLYISLNLNDQAVGALQQGLRLAPNDGTLLFGLGIVYDRKGDREQVLRIYEQLKQKSPREADLFFRELVLPKPSTPHSPRISPAPEQSDPQPDPVER